MSSASDLNRLVASGGGRPLTASELVAESLRRAILNGDLVGGTRLGLAEVARLFEVSTMPVREALRSLAVEGLIQFDPYRGGTVNAVSEEDVREIVRIRQVLEPIAVRESIENMTEPVLAEAGAVLERMKPDSGWDEWVEANRTFHMTLYSASPSQRLSAIIRGLQDPTVMFVSSTLQRHPDLRARADREHRELLDAMRAGEVERAVELTLAHLAIPLRDQAPDAH